MSEYLNLWITPVSGKPPPTPPLTQHFALSDSKLKKVGLGEG